MIALSALLAGCAPSPAPTPTPTGFASEEEAFAAAEATYRAYVDALNEVDLADPATFEPVYALTSGELNDLDRKSFSEMHASGTLVSGRTEVLSIEGSQVSDDSITLDVCTDVSDVHVVDADGNSLVSDDRKDLQSTRVSVAQVDELLALTKIEPRAEDEPCASPRP
ncbi:hypothetical protein [Microbacterium dauci]|uniref:DUF4440 domain-containing protein n=1 Tax=Microbacterium dauci TaxID=3048008 RepID=A0ABT6ZG86_9MICO|nr:hypothetical protein [Microbacterium sp. LX3-4]MDJ1115180.1 hypothetical protein [Microbacterium sp. LX3-4]